MAELVCVDLGRAPYQATLELQLALADKVRRSDDEQAYLLLVEHDPPVITLGRGGREADVLASPSELADKGVELRRCSRGGEVTFHCPGQLVAYPILRLDLHGRDVRGYLRDLEAAVIAALARLGIEARRREGLTGVWAGDRKIAAIGVAVRRWVTYHGLAINVDNDLSHFDLIVPCGLADRKVTSVSMLLERHVGVSQVKPILVECLLETFAFDAARWQPAESLRHGQ